MQAKHGARLSTFFVFIALGLPSWTNLVSLGLATNDTSDREIASWIQNLGSNRVDLIAAAENALLNCDDRAIPALRRAIIEGNLPIAPRAKVLADRIINRHILTLGSSSRFLAASAEESLFRWRYLAQESLVRAVEKKDGERSDNAARVLRRILHYTHVVLDATGKPIKDGTVELTYSLPPPPMATNSRVRDPRHSTTQTVKIVTETDLGGRTTLEVPDNAGHGLVRISHPEYGIAELEIYNGDGKSELRVELVKEGSPERDRALKGLVRGPDALPLADAQICCELIQTPGGGCLINDARAHNRVITDKHGRFAFYPLILSKRMELPGLVPRGSRYQIKVSAPKHSAIFPLATERPNSTEAIVQLEKPQRLHTIQFEDEDGNLIKEKVSLKYVAMTFRKRANDLGVLLPLDWTAEGALLLPGIYDAMDQGREYVRLKVTEDSPDELVFRRRPKTILRGRVVHGISGKPMPNAIVFSITHPRAYPLALLTDDEWEQLRTVPDGTSAFDRPLDALARCYDIAEFARTNHLGEFNITQKSMYTIRGIVAVDKDFLPIMQPTSGITFNGPHGEVADLPLFPAAKVFLKAVCGGETSVMASWRFEKNGQPEWLNKLHDATNSKQHRRFECDGRLQPELQPVYVPAGAKLSLEMSSPYEEEWSSVRSKEIIQLSQGETKTLGEIELPAAIKLEVTVVDEQRKPVEGAILRRLYTDSWSLPHLTGVNGKVSFYVNRNSQGFFALQLDEEEPPNREKTPNLFIAFNVQNEAPADKAHQIVLTAEQLQQVK